MIMVVRLGLHEMGVPDTLPICNDQLSHDHRISLIV